MKHLSDPNSADVWFRTAVASDRTVVLSLIREYYDYDDIPFDEVEITAGLETLLDEPGLGAVFLIISAGETAGYVIWTFGYDLEFGGRQATVTDVYLRTPFRRRGLGTQAIQMLEGRCPELKIKALHLQPETKNAQAIAFYKKLGFTAYQRVPMAKRVAP